MLQGCYDSQKTMITMLNRQSGRMFQIPPADEVADQMVVRDSQKRMPTAMEFRIHGQCQRLRIRQEGSGR